MTPERVLTISAHPDDIDFGAAGTLAQLTDAGSEVTVLFCTRGEQGGFDHSLHDQMPQIREREQQAASGILGITDVRFLDGHRDGWLEATYELIKQMVRVIRQVRPDLMIIQNAQRAYERVAGSHPDHLASGEAAMRAIYPAAENPFAWPELIGDEGLDPWMVKEFWVTSHPDPNHCVDITDVFDRKIAVLRAHASQNGHIGEEFEERLHDVAGGFGIQFGLGTGRLGEAFLKVRR